MNSGLAGSRILRIVVGRRTLVWGIVCLGLFVHAPVALASGSGEDLTVEELEGLSLEQLLGVKLKTGSFLELDLWRSPVTVTVIDRAKIGAASARTLSELLEIYVPGFYYRWSWENLQVWGMRGVATERNTKFIMLVNGNKQNSEALCGACTETNLGLFEDIERIEVLRGPAGLLYGSGAIAGVVNIVTSESKGTGMRLRQGVGSWRNFQADGYARHEFSSSFGMGLAAGARASGGLADHSAWFIGKDSRPLPADGAPLRAPLGFRVGMDLRWKDLRVYTRFTRDTDIFANLWAQDPYPQYVGRPPADAPAAVLADGSVVQPGDDLAFKQTRDNLLYSQVDNLLVSAAYQLALGPGKLKLHGSFTEFASSRRFDDRPGYARPAAADPYEAFGERRYAANAQYHLSLGDRLQSIVGIEGRLDDIGDDLFGRDYYGGQTKSVRVPPVIYQFVALFTEHYYEITPWLALSAGLRADKHTRTGVLLNPRAAIIWLPSRQHTVKSIFQTSTNNGQAATYESLDARQAEARRSLQPERVYSWELASAHRWKGFRLLPSVSYNETQNLFGWVKEVSRVANLGIYRFIAAEAELFYDISRLQVGASHSWQRLVWTSAQPQSIDNTQGQTVVFDGVTTYVSRNMRQFLGLPEHATKLFLSYSPWARLVLNTNARIFWGLPGRSDAFRDAASIPYFGYMDPNTPNKAMVKWNVSAAVRTPWHFSVVATGYDLLGSGQNMASVRYFADNTAQYLAIDHRAFMVTIEWTWDQQPR
jgi:outer membrane receptor protein involved in Fe transport